MITPGCGTQGFFSVARPCPDCGGEGRIVSDPCSACRGQGRIEQDRNLTVTVPPGVDGGIRLRLRGEGEHGRRGGPPGDLDVLIRVEPHERFERDGVDVHEKIELTYSQLVLGTSIKIATLYGEQPLKIPAGTSPGHEFSLRGKGIQELNSHRRGNHIVHVALRVPRPSELDEEHLDLLRKLAELEGAEIYEGGVLSKVKNLFG